MEDMIAVAEEEDLAEILAVQRRAFTKMAGILGKFDIPPLEETLAGLREDLRHCTILKYVADGRIVGSIRGHMLENGNCYLSRLSVDPEIGNRGIGRRLMLAIEDYFPDCRGFELLTSKTMPNSRHLYDTLGYVVVGSGMDGPVEIVYLEKPNPRKQTTQS